MSKKKGQGQIQQQDQRQAQRPVQLSINISEQAEAEVLVTEANLELEAQKLDSPLPAEAWPGDTSQRWIDADDPAGTFDREWSTDLGKLASLRSLRPPVLFEIDPHGDVTGKHRGPDGSHQGTAPLQVAPLRRALTEAIALHLKKEQVLQLLLQPGDWVQIPALVAPGEVTLCDAARGARKRVAYMVHLVNERYGHEAAINVAHRCNKIPGYFYRFAVRLPNDDVITPQTLLDPASTTKRASRAGALRLMRQAPGVVAGEAWDKKDWKSFRKNQSNAARGQNS